MPDEQIDALLRRTRVKEMPQEHLTGYTAEVRRRLHAPPSRVMCVRPQLGWARVLVPVGAAAALVMVVARFMPTATPPLQLAEVSLEEEAMILTTVAPEESVLPEDDAALLEELERLERELDSHSPGVTLQPQNV